MLLNHPQKLLSFGEAIDKAVSLLEKEKEQIMNAWMATDNELQRIAAEQYYNQTYK
jgi:formylmethanofuran dehydrogenase subunit B